MEDAEGRELFVQTLDDCALLSNARLRRLMTERGLAVPPPNRIFRSRAQAIRRDPAGTIAAAPCPEIAPTASRAPGE